MTRKIFQEKKKILLFLSIIILFTLTLGGCNWFGEGILNVFDPKAQIRVNHSEIKFDEDEGSIELEIYSLNKVEFIGEGFSYKYYNRGVLIPELSKTIGRTFYVEPSDTPGTPGPITNVKIPIFYNDILVYMVSSPLSMDITCTITLLGTDGAGHDIKRAVVFDLPVQYFPEINIILTANPASFETGVNVNSSLIAHVVTVPYGQPVTGLNVVFTTTGGTLTKDSDRTNAEGKATTTLTAEKNEGEKDKTYKVTAYVGDKEASVTITAYGTGED